MKLPVMTHPSVQVSPPLLSKIAWLAFLIFILILFQVIRQEASKQGEIISWLKSRLSALSEISSENEVKKQGDELSKLSSDFKRLLTLLTEVWCKDHSHSHRATYICMCLDYFSTKMNPNVILCSYQGSFLNWFNLKKKYNLKN